jgi:hypothetical protein
LIKWWKGPPVLIIVPSDTIQIRTERARGYAMIWIPTGPIEARPLTKKEKRFLLARGMASSIIKDGRVLAVSAEAANRFETDRKANVELARHLGLSEEDLFRITEAKRRLNAFRPMNFDQRRAAQGLRALLTCDRPTRQRGRPGRVTAADRIQMHQDANQLKQEGKTPAQIVRALSQRYELRISYVKRILEDGF